MLRLEDGSLLLLESGGGLLLSDAPVLPVLLETGTPLRLEAVVRLPASGDLLTQPRAA